MKIINIIIISASLSVAALSFAMNDENVWTVKITPASTRVSDSNAKATTSDLQAHHLSVPIHHNRRHTDAISPVLDERPVSAPHIIYNITINPPAACGCNIL